MPISEYADWDATAMAEQVAAGAVSAEELIEAAIRRAEALSGALNAIIHPLYDRARRRAASGALSGPFAGVPFLLKDLQQFMAGVPMSHGSAALKGFVPDEDSTLVRRFREEARPWQDRRPPLEAGA